MNSSLSALRAIHQQINNLTIGDDQAQQLEQHYQEAIRLLEAFPNPGHDFFEMRKKLILRDLAEQLTQFQRGYWHNSGQMDRIHHFTLARGQLHFLLGQALLTCRRIPQTGLLGQLRKLFGF